MKSTWTGGHECDFCHQDCGKLLIDGKTSFGSWATMCSLCFSRFGIGLGTGAGQMYVLDMHTNEYVKIKG